MVNAKAEPKQEGNWKPASLAPESAPASKLALLLLIVVAVAFALSQFPSTLAYTAYYNSSYCTIWNETFDYSNDAQNWTGGSILTVESVKIYGVLLPSNERNVNVSRTILNFDFPNPMAINLTFTLFCKGSVTNDAFNATVYIANSSGYFAVYNWYILTHNYVKTNTSSVVVPAENGMRVDFVFHREFDANTVGRYAGVANFAAGIHSSLCYFNDFSSSGYPWSGGSIASGAYQNNTAAQTLSFTKRMPSYYNLPSDFITAEFYYYAYGASSYSRTWTLSISFGNWSIALMTASGTSVTVENKYKILVPVSNFSGSNFTITFSASGPVSSATLKIDDYREAIVFSKPHMKANLINEYSPYSAYLGGGIASFIYESNGGSITLAPGVSEFYVPYNCSNPASLEYVMFWVNSSAHRKLTSSSIVSMSSGESLLIYANSPSALYQASFIVLDYTNYWSSKSGTTLEVWNFDGTKLIHSDFLDVSGYVIAFPAYGYQYRVILRQPSNESYYAGIVQAIYTDIEIPVNVYDTGVFIVPIQQPGQYVGMPQANWTGEGISQLPSGAGESLLYALSSGWGRIFILCIPLFFLIMGGKHYSMIFALVAAGFAAMLNIALGVEVYSMTVLVMIGLICILAIIVKKGEGGG